MTSWILVITREIPENLNPTTIIVLIDSSLKFSLSVNGWRNLDDRCTVESYNPQWRREHYETDYETQTTTGFRFYLIG